MTPPTFEWPQLTTIAHLSQWAELHCSVAASTERSFEIGPKSNSVWKNTKLSLDSFRGISFLQSTITLGFPHDASWSMAPKCLTRFSFAFINQWHHPQGGIFISASFSVTQWWGFHSSDVSALMPQNDVLRNQSNLRRNSKPRASCLLTLVMC